MVDAVLPLRDTRIDPHVFSQMLDVVMFGGIEHSQGSIPNLQFTLSPWVENSTRETGHDGMGPPGRSTGLHAEPVSLCAL